MLMNPKLVEFEGLKEQYRKAVRKWSKTHCVPLRDEKCWWYMFISNKHKVTMSYVSLHARTHARTYVCMYSHMHPDFSVCISIYIYKYLYIHIYVTWISPQWVPMTTTSGSPGVWMDQTPGSPRALRALSWWPLQYIRLTYSNTQKGRKVKSYKFTQWLLFYLVGGCDNWSCEWIWVVFLSFSCGAPCWYSFQH